MVSLLEILKLENYTKYQKEMLGKSYINCKGNSLTVVGVKGTKNKKTIYTLSCSECSVDEELFPEGTITCVGDSIKSERTVCGCSKKFKWKEYQYIIRIKRRCEELGYLFKGFAQEYKGYKTRILLHNPSTNNTWDTTSIQTFLLKGVKDPLLKVQKLTERCTLPDENLKGRFMATGRFIEGTLFERCKDNRWSYTCPTCSYDEYVANRLCDGKFTSSAGHLLEGKSCCRCHKGSYRWSEDQRSYQVVNYLSPLGHKFVGWEDGYLNTRSTVMWECKLGHANKTSFCNLKSRMSCKTCSANGFKPHLPASIYIVRWSNKDHSLLKFGITNKKVDSRITSQNKKSPLSPVLLHEFHHSSGQYILDCENAIKGKMETGCERELLPSGFTETVKDTPENLETLLQIISTFNLK